MASFTQKFSANQADGGGNSIQQEIMLESMKAAQESLAAIISQETSASGNMERILGKTASSKHAPTATAIGEEEASLEQEIEEHSLEIILEKIERARSPEEITEWLQEYEELLQSWSEKASALRNKKHLKEYLSIVAALAMLKTMTQHPELLSGNALSEMVKTNVKSQQQFIEQQANKLQLQHQKIYEQQQATKQTEHTLQPTIVVQQQQVQATVSQLQNARQQQQLMQQQQQARETTIRAIEQSKTTSIAQQTATTATIEQARQTTRQVQAAREQQQNVINLNIQSQQQARQITTTTVAQTEQSALKAEVASQIKAQTQENQQTKQPQAMGKDAISKAHAHGAGCGCSGCKGAAHSHQHTSPEPKAMGKDAISKAHAHGAGCGCSGCKGHASPEPKAMGKDVVSKAHAHGAGCGCPTCTGQHKHQAMQTQAQQAKEKPQKQHVHGPSCGCCGHSAKATEVVNARSTAMITAAAAA